MTRDSTNPAGRPRVPLVHIDTNARYCDAADAAASLGLGVSTIRAALAGKGSLAGRLVRDAKGVR